MIVTIIETLGGWSWWILGLVLIGVEVVAPGFFFLAFGVAAILVGVGALLMDWPWQLQLIGFTVLFVAAALVSRNLARTAELETGEPRPQMLAERMQGRTFVLAEPIVGGSGRLRIDDAVWPVRGPDAPAGAQVTVKGADGSILNVEETRP